MPGPAQESTETDPARHAAPVIENDAANFTNSGSIKLQWHSRQQHRDSLNVVFELQRATLADFADAKTYYRGPDLATYISGLANGTYYYRLREVNEDRIISHWSSPVSVQVEHHSLSLAFTLFGIGALVFVLTLIVVVRGAAHTPDPDDTLSHANPPAEV